MSKDRVQIFNERTDLLKDTLDICDKALESKFFRKHIGQNSVCVVDVAKIDALYLEREGDDFNLHAIVDSHNIVIEVFDDAVDAQTYLELLLYSQVRIEMESRKHQLLMNEQYERMIKAVGDSGVEMPDFRNKLN